MGDMHEVLDTASQKKEINTQMWDLANQIWDKYTKYTR